MPSTMVTRSKRWIAALSLAVAGSLGVTGGLNLAVGSIGVASVMLGGWAMQVAGAPVLPSMTLAVAFGAFLGWINGQLTVRMGVHSFIVTLATMSLFFGAMIVATRAEAFNALPRSFVDLGKLRYGGFVSGMLPLALIVALVGLVLPVPLMALDLLIGFLQAYIFTVLASVYIGAAIRVGEEEST